MKCLLVGFDSAWTAKNAGGLVGLLFEENVGFSELGPPNPATFSQAEQQITCWQAEYQPDETIIMIDQPTIVSNAAGQRPVENLVGSVVSRRHGGMQPANQSRAGMFDTDAPIWPFLHRFGGTIDLQSPKNSLSGVIETYPVLTIIARDWVLEDSRPGGRLPKYNPKQRRSFKLEDWKHLCIQLADNFRETGLYGIAAWLDEKRIIKPSKADQDGLDACICLLVGVYLVTRKPCLIVGNQEAGAIVVPDNPSLRAELEVRCIKTGRDPTDWMRTV